MVICQLDLVELKWKLWILMKKKAGRALFEIVAICRKAGLDPENCLRTFVQSNGRDFGKQSR